MKTRPRSRRNRHGLTLIEVLLVLVILLILGSLAVTVYSNIGKKAKRDLTRTQINELWNTVKLYETTMGQFPATLDDLFDAPPDLVDPEDWAGPYLDKYPKDAWGYEIAYEYPGPQNGEFKPDIWSFGPNGIDGDEDDIGNWFEE